MDQAISILKKVKIKWRTFLSSLFLTTQMLRFAMSPVLFIDSCTFHILIFFFRLLNIKSQSKPSFSAMNQCEIQVDVWFQFLTWLYGDINNESVLGQKRRTKGTMFDPYTPNGVFVYFTLAKAWFPSGGISRSGRIFDKLCLTARKTKEKSAPVARFRLMNQA